MNVDAIGWVRETFVGKSGFLCQDHFPPFEFRMLEIEDEAGALFRNSQVIEHLAEVFVVYALDDLGLDDEGVFHFKVWNVPVDFDIAIENGVDFSSVELDPEMV
jgi:hypothetical protein